MSIVGISGMSSLTALGVLNVETEKKIFQGDTGIVVSLQLESLGLASKKAARVEGFVPEAFDDSAAYCRLPRAFQFAVYVVSQALVDAGLSIGALDPERTGVFYGTGLAAISDVERFYQPIVKGGLQRGSPIVFPNTTSSVGCGLISIKYKARGKTIALSTGGVSGIQGIEMAKLCLETGELDTAIVVGTDELCETVFKAYYYTRMLARRTSYNEEKCRPFNKRSNGIIIGEGAAALILEREESVLRRNRKPRSMVLGTASANHCMEVYPRRSGIGKGTGLTICAALNEAEIKTESVDLIVAAGNGNRYLDLSEAGGIRNTFGERSDHIPVIVPSAIFGETVGPGSILGAICGTLMLERQKTIPMSSLDPSEYDAGLKLNMNSEEVRLSTILVNGSSFYGETASLVLGRSM